MMTYEKFYCGFTSDSHPSFSCSPDQGKMENRNGPPTQITVTCNPQGKSGELTVRPRTPSRPGVRACCSGLLHPRAHHDACAVVVVSDGGGGALGRARCASSCPKRRLSRRTTVSPRRLSKRAAMD
eukprot:2635813-Prymnesium_polylepis.1